MDNEHLETALQDLADAIEGITLGSITLGSIEFVVIEAAGKELIYNWNDHNRDNPINEDEELKNWHSVFFDEA